MDPHGQALPGVTVTIRSFPQGTLVWEGTTGSIGHVHQKIDAATITVTVELETFYTHYERLEIPSGKKCLMVIITKQDPNPNIVFKVT